MDYKLKLPKNLEEVLFGLIIYYHVIFLFVATFFPTHINKLAFIMLIFIYIYYNKNVAIKNKYEFVIINSILILTTLYSISMFHLFQIVHSDYYSFWLEIFCLLVFVDEKVRDKFYLYFISRIKEIIISIIIFFLMLIYSFVFLEGLHSGYGIALPILYGPYAVPHILAYSLLGIYCSLVVISRRKPMKIVSILKIICVICSIWTAARSGVLAMAILVTVDYIQLKKASKKIVIFMLGLCVAIYIIFFTDILVNNPLIQKTMVAISGGSVTNGRARFVSIVMDHYMSNASVVEKIMGMGMNNVRDILYRDSTVKVAIHAHNEYINALCGFGIVGFILIIYTQLKVFFIRSKWYNKSMFALFIFLLSYYNGLAMYTVLTPVLIIVLCMFEKMDLKNNDIYE